MWKRRRYIFFFLLVLLICVSNMLLINGVTNVLDVLRIPFQLVLLVFLIIQLAGFKRHNVLSPYSLISTILIFIFYIFIQTLLFSSNYLNDISNSLYGFICLLVFYTNPYIQNEKYLKSIIISSLVFFSLLFLYFRLNPPMASSPINNNHSLYVNSIYYVVCLLPFILAYHNSFIYLIITVICVLVSGKQGAVVGVALSFLTYNLVDWKIHGGIIDIKMIFRISFLVMLMFVLYEYVNDIYSINILDGFDTISEDGGNGRLDIYALVVDKLWSSNIISFLLGHGGLGAVAKDFGISAHNDFLEIFYDFGLVGLSLYVTILLKLILIGKRFLRVNYPLAPAFVSSIILFLVLSSISHIVFILKYAMILFSFWGYCLNKYLIYEYKNCSISSK